MWTRLLNEAPESFRVLGAVETQTPHTIESIHPKYDLDTAVLPSGKAASTRSGLSEHAARSWIDPETLVPSTSSSRPAVSDSLAILIETGKLRPTSDHETYEILEEIDALPRGIRGTFIPGRSMNPPEAHGRVCIADWRGKPVAGISMICR